MIVTRISDGFGNQLFMYACGYAVARRVNAKLMLDISFLDTNGLRKYELDKLNIIYDKIFHTKALKLYLLKVMFRKLIHGVMHITLKQMNESKTNIYMYDKHILQVSDGTYLNGYWQNENYFKDYKNDLISMITPNYNQSEEYDMVRKRIMENESVAIHIRRGDYVALNICLGKDYYDKAINYISNKIDCPIYYVFSDDIEYARKLLQNRDEKIEFVKYKSNNPTLDDFFLMKDCKHMIMANSSYSWWAAWLKKNPERIIIRPKTEGNFKNEFYPDKWIEL